MNATNQSPVVRIPLRVFDAAVVWAEDGVTFEGFNSEAELAWALMSDDGSPIGRFLIGFQQAENAGLLDTVDAVREAIEAFEQVLAYRFVWPEQWGPVRVEDVPQLRQEALNQQFRRCPLAAKLMLARSVRDDIKAAVASDPGPSRKPGPF